MYLFTTFGGSQAGDLSMLLDHFALYTDKLGRVA
jgi:hypothetical protein